MQGRGEARIGPAISPTPDHGTVPERPIGGDPQEMRDSTCR